MEGQSWAATAVKIMSGSRRTKQSKDVEEVNKANKQREKTEIFMFNFNKPHRGWRESKILW